VDPHTQIYSSSDPLDPQQGLLHLEVWIVPTWESSLAPHLLVLNLHMNSLNPLALYWNLDLKWIIECEDSSSRTSGRTRVYACGSSGACERLSSN
jgi:hypothetical protein